MWHQFSKVSPKHSKTRLKQKFLYIDKNWVNWTVLKVFTKVCICYFTLLLLFNKHSLILFLFNIPYTYVIENLIKIFIYQMHNSNATSISLNSLGYIIKAKYIFSHYAGQKLGRWISKNFFSSIFIIISI